VGRNWPDLGEGTRFRVRGMRVEMVRTMAGMMDGQGYNWCGEREWLLRLRVTGRVARRACEGEVEVEKVRGWWSGWFLTESGVWW